METSMAVIRPGYGPGPAGSSFSYEELAERGGDCALCNKPIEAAGETFVHWHGGNNLNLHVDCVTHFVLALARDALEVGYHG
jgi:hypothetical protein